MVWTLRFGGNGLRFWRDKESALRRALPPEDRARFTDWAGRYGRAVKARNNGELLKIGGEIFGWLEADGHDWSGLLTGGTGEIGLDIVADENPGTDALAEEEDGGE